MAREKCELPLTEPASHHLKHQLAFACTGVEQLFQFGRRGLSVGILRFEILMHLGTRPLLQPRVVVDPHPAQLLVMAGYAVVSAGIAIRLFRWQ